MKSIILLKAGINLWKIDFEGEKIYFPTFCHMHQMVEQRVNNLGAVLRFGEVSHPGPQFPAGEDTWTQIDTKIGEA